MAITRTDICNQALALASQPPIVAIEDDNPRARVCLSVYETTKNTLLALDNWNFALFRSALVRSDAAPAFGYAYKFALPVEPRYLRFVEHDKNPSMQWSIEGQFLLCDEENIAIRYVGEVGEGQFSDAFAKTMAAHVAYEIAPLLDQDDSKGEVLHSLYQRHMADAARVDALATKSRRIHQDHPRSYLGRGYNGRLRR